MKRVIWKYELTQEKTPLRLPFDATVLSVQVQHARVVLWVEVATEDADSDKRFTRAFQLRPTGIPYDTEPGEAFVGTVQLEGSALVYHVFEVSP
jgi:hypothetical protein